MVRRRCLCRDGGAFVIAQLCLMVLFRNKSVPATATDSIFTGDQRDERRLSPGSFSSCPEGSLLSDYLTCAYGPSGDIETCYNMPSCSCTQIWSGFRSYPGPLPDELFSCTQLTTLWFTGVGLNGSISSAIGNLTELTTLYLNDGDNALTGSIPTTIGSLTDLMYVYISNNQLNGTIPTEVGHLTQLARLFLDQNRLSGPIPSEFGQLTKLEFLDLNSNLLTGPVPVFHDNPDLNLLLLSRNRLESVPAFAFENISHTPGERHVIDLSFQDDSVALELKPECLHGILNAEDITFAGTTLLTIPPALFGGVSSTWREGTLRLVGNDIQVISSGAFAVHPTEASENAQSRPRIDLRENYVRYMSHEAFDSTLQLRNDGCTDVGLWEVQIPSAGTTTLNTYNCTDFHTIGTDCLTDCTAFHLNDIGSGETTVQQSCCSWGGGYLHGKDLLMSPVSPVFCRVPNEMDVSLGFNTTAVCMCTDSRNRYDVRGNMCLETCSPGQVWRDVPGSGVHKGVLPTTIAGWCESCPEGKTSATGDFSNDDCDSCSPGKYMPDSGHTECLRCEIGRYAPAPEATTCLVCANGSATNHAVGSRECVPCESGSYSFTLKGATVCTDCPSGRYAGDDRSTSCEQCPAGSMPLYPGVFQKATKCESCVAGQYAAVSGLESCLECDRGRYSLANATECLTCPPGKEVSGNETSCVDLAPGLYGIGEMCAENTFSTGGALVCSTCSRGKRSDAGASKCQACDAMYYFSDHCEWPIFGIVLGVVIFVAVTSAFCSVHRHFRKQNEKIASRAAGEMARANEDRDMLESAWRIDWDSVDLVAPLATGSYGEVWSGFLNGSMKVVVKKLFQSDSLDLKDEKEIRFLMRARHPRLVMFMGCGRVENDGDLFIVLEFCNAGTLRDYLYKDGKEIRRTWSERLSLLCDVAEGLSWLHLRHNAIHRDLKCDNCLLHSSDDSSSRLRAKVADFGLSRIFSDVNDDETKEPATKKTPTSRTKSGLLSALGETGQNSFDSGTPTSTMTMTAGIG
eukprot:g4750.t1